MVDKKTNRGLAVLAILALLLLLLGKKPAGGDGGGVASPSGSIGTVDVTQNYAARAHLIPKSVGDIVTITVTWTAATKNSLGEPIPWNYGISWRYRKDDTGDLRDGGFFNLGSRPNGTFSFGASDILDASFISGNWDVEVALHADNSSADGQPLNDMPALEDDALLIGLGQHNNAFQVI